MGGLMGDVVEFPKGKTTDSSEEDSSDQIDFFKCTCGCGCFFVADKSDWIICADCGEGWTSLTLELQDSLSGSIHESDTHTPSGVDGAAECSIDDYGSLDQT